MPRSSRVGKCSWTQKSSSSMAQCFCRFHKEGKTEISVEIITLELFIALAQPVGIWPWIWRDIIKVTGDSLLIHVFAYLLFIGVCSVTSNMTGYSICIIR